MAAGSFSNYGAQLARDGTTLTAEAAGALRYYSLSDLPKYAGESNFARSKGLLFRSSEGSPSRSEAGEAVASALFDGSTATCYRSNLTSFYGARGGGQLESEMMDAQRLATEGSGAGYEFLRIDLGEDFNILRVKIAGPASDTEAHQLYGASLYVATKVVDDGDAAQEE